MTLTFPFCLDLHLNGLTDGELAGTLADFSEVCTREAMCDFSQIIQVHILSEEEKYYGKGLDNEEKNSLLFCQVSSSIRRQTKRRADYELGIQDPLVVSTSHNTKNFPSSIFNPTFANLGNR